MNVIKDYHPNGKVRSKTAYVKGLKQGLETRYRENGRRQSEVMWRNDARHGIETIWYENGEICAKTAYVNDKEHGVESVWRENGTKSLERMWRGGKRHGVEFYRDEYGGKVSIETYYLRGNEYARIEWDEDGNTVEVKFPPRPNNKSEPKIKSKSQKRHRG